jgi:uncharacterized protein YecA (UPF0149 family)
VRIEMGIFRKIGSFFKAEETRPVRKLGRNDLCWCGSGKKYKRCHLEEDEKKKSKLRAASCTTS